MTGKRFAIIGNQAFALLNFRGRLIADMVAAGAELFALAPDFSDADRASLRAIGVEPIDFSLSRTGTNPLRDLADMLRLTRILRALRLDAVLSVMIKPVIYGTFAAWLAGVPDRFAMITGLGYAFGDQGGRSPGRAAVRKISRTLYGIALARARGVFMQNPDDVADFVNAGILPREKLLGVYPTGVDLAEWAPAPTVSEPVTFVLAARLLREKGVHEFVAAARAVKQNAPEVRFIVLGGLDSNPNGVPETQMRAWTAEGIIEWPGHVAVRPWLAQASVFVLPSYYREGVPRSTQEAMAMARAIITTDMPGCRETVVDGRNGYLIPAQDVDALAAAMRNFLVEPQLIATMGAQSRELAVERFDVAKINARIVAAMGL